MTHNLNHEPRPSFVDTVEAMDWMYAEIDDPCNDNFRFAWLDDEQACRDYDALREEGCCGYFDEIVLIGGREAKIGCNYGH